jgi:hypothetical protein
VHLPDWDRRRSECVEGAELEWMWPESPEGNNKTTESRCLAVARAPLTALVLLALIEL